MSNKKTINNKKGFTLIELVVVIAILAVLALILIPSITGYVDKANNAKHEANVRSIYTSAVLINSTNDLKEGETLTTRLQSEYSQTDLGGTIVADASGTNVTVSLNFTDGTKYEYANGKLTVTP